LYGDRLKGKDYYRGGKLEFEGEYLFNNKWNGKGYDENDNIIYDLKNGNSNVKEYYYCKLEFVGEYLNGKRNGKGKEYDCYDGKLIFEGEYLNGVRNGKEKEYDDDKLIFEVEYLNGEKQ